MLRIFLDRYIAPADRMSELLFGLIMVLTYTVSARPETDGRDATRETLVGAVGNNLAWGLISGVLFIVYNVFERGRTMQLVQTVRQTSGREEALAILRDELDDKLETLAGEAERERLYCDILTRVGNLQPPQGRIRREDVIGALIVFVLVFSAAIPAVVPFWLIEDLRLAVRVSNGLLIGMLFLVGFFWARRSFTNPWLGGLALTVLGGLLVGLAEIVTDVIGG